MNLKYYKAEKGNFGDDLNPYIFNSLFPSLFREDKELGIDFYGIGTIIDSRIPFHRKAVFFGTGIRDIARTYQIDNWDIFFLRGPVSSNVLGFSTSKSIVDSAYLILFTKGFIKNNMYNKKRYELSIIPHHEQMDMVDWSIVKEQTGYNIINPRDSVENVIAEISRSEKIVAGAMHGAIMADICRVPWIRLRMDNAPYETPLISDMKWLDWLRSIGIFHDVNISINNFNIQRSSKQNLLFYEELIPKMINAKKQFCFLSDDGILESKIHQLAEQIELFKSKYGKDRIEK